MLLVPVTRADLVAYLPQGLNMAEIGVAKGGFSRVLLEKCAPARLYMIDPWEHQDVEHLAEDSNNPDQTAQNERFDQVSHEFSPELKTGQVVLLRAYSHLAAEQIEDRSLDAVYIDGDHSFDAVLRDLNAFAPKLRPGGLILGHDYTNHAVVEFGVIAAVNTFVQERDYKFLAITTLDAFPTYAIAPALEGAAKTFAHTALAGVPGVVELANYPAGYSFSPKYIRKASGGTAFIPSFSTAST